MSTLFHHTHISPKHMDSEVPESIRFTKSQENLIAKSIFFQRWIHCNCPIHRMRNTHLRCKLHDENRRPWYFTLHLFEQCSHFIIIVHLHSSAHQKNPFVTKMWANLASWHRELFLLSEIWAYYGDGIEINDEGASYLAYAFSSTTPRCFDHGRIAYLLTWGKSLFSCIDTRLPVELIWDWFFTVLEWHLDLQHTISHIWPALRTQ